MVDGSVVVGLDNGGTSNNATVLDATGAFLVDRLLETPSLVREGPKVAVEALAAALENVLSVTGVPRSAVRAVGLDTPGPASADGVISAKGATNFSEPEWRGFDFRGALDARLDLPVVYNNDGNAAALYAHRAFFGAEAPLRSSISAIVGTGLGGGVIESGTIVRGAAGMAGELGHVQIPMAGLLEPRPAGTGVQLWVLRRRGERGVVDRDPAEPAAVLADQVPGHELATVDAVDRGQAGTRATASGAIRWRSRIFEQQAMAIGRLFTIAANFTDPHAYFVGGGVVEAAPDFRDWFLDTVREHTALRAEQAPVVGLRAGARPGHGRCPRRRPGRRRGGAGLAGCRDASPVSRLRRGRPRSRRSGRRVGRRRVPRRSGPVRRRPARPSSARGRPVRLISLSDQVVGGGRRGVLVVVDADRQHRRGDRGQRRLRVHRVDRGKRPCRAV